MNNTIQIDSANDLPSLNGSKPLVHAELSEKAIHLAACMYASLQAEQIRAGRLDDPRTFYDDNLGYMQGTSHLSDFYSGTISVSKSSWIYLGTSFWHFLLSAVQTSPSTALLAKLRKNCPKNHDPDLAGLVFTRKPVPSWILHEELKKKIHVLPAPSLRKIFQVHDRISFSPETFRVIWKEDFYSENGARLSADLSWIHPFYVGISFPESVPVLYSRIKEWIRAKFPEESSTFRWITIMTDKEMDRYQTARSSLKDARSFNEAMELISEIEQVHFNLHIFSYEIQNSPVSDYLLNHVSDSFGSVCQSLNCHRWIL